MNISTGKSSNPFIGDAKFVVIDETRFNLCPLEEMFEGKKITFVPEYPNDLMAKHKFAVYTAPKIIVRGYIAARPNRYKLFESDPMEIQERGPSFQTVFKTYKPWKLVLTRAPDGRAENGEIIYKEEVNWVEVQDNEPRAKK